MRRRVFLGSVLIVLAGCGNQAPPGTAGTAPPAGGTASGGPGTPQPGAPSSRATAGAASASPAGGGASSGRFTAPGPVLQPTDLLTAAEVSKVVGVPVKLAGTADLDEELGTVYQRYEYDLGQTTVLGLLQITQDGGRTGPGSAAEDYAAVKKLVAKEITPIAYGDDAFLHRYGQLHALYRGYYLVLAFNGDEEGSVEQKVRVNKELGQLALAHLRQKVG